MRSLILCALLAACSGGKSDDATGGSAGDTGGGDDTASGGDGGATSGDCPDAVPEEYRNIWDCDASACDDGVVLYHVAAASSTADDPPLFSGEEQFFIFEDSGDWCVDTFSLEGEYSAYDPATFGCSECEEIYQVEMTLTSGNDCGLMWGSLITGDKDDDGPWTGFFMFETHNEINDERNEDNKMYVVATMYNASEDAWSIDANYGNGYALPTSEVDGPPQDYTWASNANCLRTSGAGVSRSGGPLSELVAVEADATCASAE